MQGEHKWEAGPAEGGDGEGGAGRLYHPFGRGVTARQVANNDDIHPRRHSFLNWNAK